MMDGAKALCAMRLAATRKVVNKEAQSAQGVDPSAHGGDQGASPHGKRLSQGERPLDCRAPCATDKLKALKSCQKKPNSETQAVET